MSFDARQIAEAAVMGESNIHVDLPAPVRISTAAEITELCALGGWPPGVAEAFISRGAAARDVLRRLAAAARVEQ